MYGTPGRALCMRVPSSQHCLSLSSSPVLLLVSPPRCLPGGATVLSLQLVGRSRESIASSRSSPRALQPLVCGKLSPSKLVCSKRSGVGYMPRLPTPLQCLYNTEMLPRSSAPAPDTPCLWLQGRKRWPGD
ncbi:hypothetical protein E2C01_084167 [Portunus trituberculatus]|uniref:Uncharacterized protein n=1 Tax=Portunus trituberculatus TaxID=210409 RepID=A0A5B7IXJ4_PORTR|nr:hypothetical protein [Portunus trituberculatus]